MILTRGAYDLETGYFYTSTHVVDEKPKTYRSNDFNRFTFYKEEEEKVRYLKGNNSPYLEVYTTQTENAIEKLQTLVSDYLEKRIQKIPVKTFHNGILIYNKDLLCKYINELDLSNTNITKEDLLEDEVIDSIYTKIKEFPYRVNYTDVINILQDTIQELEEVERE